MENTSAPVLKAAQQSCLTWQRLFKWSSALTVLSVAAWIMENHQGI